MLNIPIYTHDGCPVTIVSAERPMIPVQIDQFRQEMVPPGQWKCTVQPICGGDTFTVTQSMPTLCVLRLDDDGKLIGVDAEDLGDDSKTADPRKETTMTMTELARTDRMKLEQNGPGGPLRITQWAPYEGDRTEITMELPAPITQAIAAATPDAREQERDAALARMENIERGVMVMLRRMEQIERERLLATANDDQDTETLEKIDQRLAAVIEKLDAEKQSPDPPPVQVAGTWQAQNKHIRHVLYDAAGTTVGAVYRRYDGPHDWECFEHGRHCGDFDDLDAAKGCVEALTGMRTDTPTPQPVIQRAVWQSNQGDKGREQLIDQETGLVLGSVTMENGVYKGNAPDTIAAGSPWSAVCGRSSAYDARSVVETHLGFTAGYVADSDGGKILARTVTP